MVHLWNVGGREKDKTGWVFEEKCGSVFLNSKGMLGRAMGRVRKDVLHFSYRRKTNDWSVGKDNTMVCFHKPPMSILHRNSGVMWFRGDTSVRASGPVCNT